LSTNQYKIHIIGVGNDGLRGLTAHERELLLGAELLLGSRETLDLVPEARGERQVTSADLQKVVDTLSASMDKKRMVLLVGGDPLFYGLARYLCDRLGKDHFEVHPHVSSMQLAFARLKESWEDAYLTNLQTHPLESVLDRIRTAETVGLFTSEEESPKSVARFLLAQGVDYFRMYVCENLGGPNERVTQGELAEIIEMDFDPLNIIILKRKPGRPDRPARRERWRMFGNPDDAFAQSKPKHGLITQAEVRALALSQLAIHTGDVIWDIGAGSGSVAIEAARLSDPGMVYAIEQAAADYHLILANADMMGVKNVKAIQGVAPGVFHGLPAPDAVFVGAVGRESLRLTEESWKALRPGGRLVINLASLESLNAIYTHLKQQGKVEVLLIQVARGVEQVETLRFEAVNPTFLILAEKPSA
jgi:precorrin-6Y C5,15-methyltransferase (decarboxylating)